MGGRWEAKFNRWTKIDSFVLWFENLLDKVVNHDLNKRHNEIFNNPMGE